MSSKMILALGLASIAILFADEALAHSLGASGAGFAHGLTHAYMGLDHLLAMVAVGLWASQLGGSCCWRVPLAFVTMMTAAALFATSGGVTFSVEAVIGLSVFTVGVLVAFSIRVTAFWSVLTVSAFAVFHGYAHGLEMPQAATPWRYGLGLVLATASLHALGVALGFGLRRRELLLRSSGAAIAAAGLYWLAAS
jgi:urease accessory protein